jgi:hypothetical protein
MHAGVVIRFVAAAVLISFGVAVIVLSLLAILDPVGTKHADDADPLGPPPSRAKSTIILLVGCGFIAVAGFLIRSGVQRAGAA